MPQLPAVCVAAARHLPGAAGAMGQEKPLVSQTCCVCIDVFGRADSGWTSRGKIVFMFQTLKKILGQSKAQAVVGTPGEQRASPVNIDLSDDTIVGLTADPAHPQHLHVDSKWRQGPGAGIGIQGVLHGKPWKLERAAASRNYISGEEIRGRADIAVDPQATIVIMNRPLKELLEKRAYALYTDSVETHAGPTLMEEMRWLALYPEVGWEKPPDSFWKRYAVMTDHRAQAINWVTPELADLLTSWPQPATDANVPFILMVMRGKAHLRMQLTPAGMDTLDHITQVFTTAAKSAIDVFSASSGESATTVKK